MGILLKDQKVLYADVNLGQIDVSTPVTPVIPTHVSVTSVVVSPRGSATAALAGSSNATLQLIATVYPNNATDKSVTWSVDDSSLATINQNGLLTRVASASESGSVIVTATASNGVTGSLTVSLLTSSATIEVESVSVSVRSGRPGYLTAVQGSSTQLIASVSPLNASNKQITWSSSNTSLATVDEDGLVTRSASVAREGGGSDNVTITATASNGVSGSISIEVRYEPAEETEEFPIDYPWIRLEGSDLSSGFSTESLTKSDGTRFTCRNWPMRAGTNALYMNGVDGAGTATGTAIPAYSTYGLVCPGSGFVNGATLNENSSDYETFPMDKFTLAMRFKYNANVEKTSANTWGPPGYGNLQVSSGMSHGRDFLFCIYKQGMPTTPGTPMIRVHIAERPHTADAGVVNGEVYRKIGFEYRKYDSSGKHQQVFEFLSEPILVATGTNGNLVGEDIVLILRFKSSSVSMFVNGVQVMNENPWGANYFDIDDFSQWAGKHFVTVGTISGADWKKEDLSQPFGGIISDNAASGCFVGEIAHVSVAPEYLSTTKVNLLIAALNESVVARNLSLESYARVRTSLIEAYPNATVLEADEYLDSFIESEQSVG